MIYSTYVWLTLRNDLNIGGRNHKADVWEKVGKIAGSFEAYLLFLFQNQHNIMHFNLKSFLFPSRFI